jgi:hypothetical protein
MWEAVTLKASGGDEDLGFVLDCSGRAPYRVSAIVVQTRSGEVVWLLVPEGTDEEWEVVVGSGIVLGPSGSAEDLAALEAAAVEIPARGLDGFRLGAVPPGFVQAIPRGGAAPQFAPGTDYIVGVFGPTGGGGASFRMARGRRRGPEERP